MRDVEMNRKKLFLTTAIVILFSLVLPIYAGEPTEPHAGNALWIEPSVSDLRGLAVGDKFNITVWINFTSIDPGDYIGAWQFAIVYKKGYIEALRGGYTEGTISQWFKNAGVETTYQVSFQKGSFNGTHNYVLHGETWLSGPKAGEGTYGSLSWIEFNITATPADTVTETFSFITTGTIRSKLLNENNVNVIDQFSPFEGTYIIPEFTPALAIAITVIATSTATISTKKFRKK
jgi:hypothetical protein